MLIYIRLYAVFIAVSYTLFTAILQSIFLFLHFSIYCNMRLVQFDIYFSHHFHIFMLNYIAYIIRYEIIMMQWLIVRFLLTVKIRQCCKFRCYTDSSIIAFVITMIELCCMLQVQKTLLARLPSPGLLLQDSGACLTACFCALHPSKTYCAQSYQHPGWWPLLLLKTW